MCLVCRLGMACYEKSSCLHTYLLGWRLVLLVFCVASRGVLDTEKESKCINPKPGNMAISVPICCLHTFCGRVHVRSTFEAKSLKLDLPVTQSSPPAPSKPLILRFQASTTSMPHRSPLKTALPLVVVLTVRNSIPKYAIAWKQSKRHVW